MPTLAQFDTVPAHKIAYLVMRKCGCSSIKHALSRIRDKCPVPQNAVQIHENLQFQVLANDIYDQPDWFTFTVVRDPIIRFLSFYANKILDQNLDVNHTFLNRHRFGFLPNMSVDQVIDILVDQEFETEPHLIPQTELVAQVGFELDYIGHLEEMGKCLEEIESRTGVRLPTQHLNRATQKPILPNRDQFEKLADFYRNDLIEFEYPDNFEDWYQINVEGRESDFQFEAGYTFDNEAKLLHHSIARRANQFVIRLVWRVHELQSRKRVIRLVQKVGSRFETLWHLPPLEGLGRDCSADRIVHDTIEIPFSRLPDHIDLDHVYHELFFSDKQKKRALLSNYLAHDNMLIFGFGHLKKRRCQ